MAHLRYRWVRRRYRSPDAVSNFHAPKTNQYFNSLRYFPLRLGEPNIARLQARKILPFSRLDARPSQCGDHAATRSIRRERQQPGLRTEMGSQEIAVSLHRITDDDARHRQQRDQLLWGQEGVGGETL